jgi:hypothetical protein
MEIVIKKPSEISEIEMAQILDLIQQGSQIVGERDVIAQRLKNASFIGFISDDGRIISTATLKNPADSYRTKVFTNAGVDSLEKIYKYELGYTVTAKDREGEKLCQTLLTSLYSLIRDYKIFATSRKESIIHILGKYGFEVAGNNYNRDLSLLIN